MHTIHKYPLHTYGFNQPFNIQMPIGATPIAVQTQQGIPCMWARVDDDLPRDDRRFLICGTGFPLPRKGAYIGTFQLGALVGHVWEIMS
jgi:hypothetical protein